MLIDGKTIAKDIEEEIRQALLPAYTRPPCLAVVIVGNDPASQVYVSFKQKACERVGIQSERLTFEVNTSQNQLLAAVETLNQRDDVDGILVQLPLPSHIDPSAVCLAIDPAKDVDGFHPYNVGKMLMGETDSFLPCTPAGIQLMLKRSGIATEGQHVVIVGRSNIVGKPLAALLMQKGEGANATVTVAHSRTANLAEVCRSADILVAAIGRPHMITSDMVTEGTAVIDVGTNRVDDVSKARGYRVVGDVDFEAVRDKVSAISPVPGGVGPMTIAMLLNNTLKSFQGRVCIA